MSEPLGRQEKGHLAVEWVAAGDRQEMGGEELLRLRFYILFDRGWVPLQNGSIKTQVRKNEEKSIRLRLLDKVIKEVSPLIEAAIKNENLGAEKDEYPLANSRDLFDKYRWLGPEMAEEY